jgi:hypothetical protein
MTIKRVAVFAALATCITSAALAQEQAVAVAIPSDEAGWQKQCLDKADHDDLDNGLRLTFMTECVAGAKLDAQSPATK